MQIIYQTAKPFDQLLKKQKMQPGQTYRPMYYVVEQPVDEGLLLYHTMTKALLLTHEEVETYKTNPTAQPQLVEQGGMCRNLMTTVCRAVRNTNSRTDATPQIPSTG